MHISCSVLFVSVLVVLPAILLSHYPIKLFRRLLHPCLPLLLRLILSTFLDTLKGHYRDGTDGTRDYRFMSAVHFDFTCSNRLVSNVPQSNPVAISLNLYTVAICILWSVLFAIVRPCKNK